MSRDSENGKAGSLEDAILMRRWRAKRKEYLLACVERGELTLDEAVRKLNERQRGQAA